MEQTNEKLLKLLKRRGLYNLVTELEGDSGFLEDWKKRTEAQWKDELQLLGNPSGFSDIYNCLHPQSESS